jgi:hypothetical protein
VKKLKVTWHDRGQSIATADVHVQSKVSLLGEILVFQDPGASAAVLMIPQGRLISAVEIEAAE